MRDKFPFSNSQVLTNLDSTGVISTNIWDFDDDIAIWVTSTAYVVGNVVMRSGTYYKCGTAHTSGTFATDLASGYWTAIGPVEQIVGYLNVIIIGKAYTSGLTEGVVVALRTDDAVGLATAKDGASDGYVEAAMKGICYENLNIGEAFSIPIYHDVAKKYAGAWFAAKSAALVGTVTVDAWFDLDPVSKRAMQKKPV